MTCREKLKLKLPEFSEDRIDDITRSYCPFEMGIDYPLDQVCRHSSCRTCWDTEIPENEIKKENETMPTHDISVNTKRTKAELIEEIKLAHEHIIEMQSRLERMDKYKQYEECADELKAMHTALINSGFTNDQAFELMKTTIQAIAPAAMRGMSL